MKFGRTETNIFLHDVKLKNLRDVEIINYNNYNIEKTECVEVDPKDFIKMIDINKKLKRILNEDC